MSALVSFLEGTGQDTHGRLLADILEWPDAQLERAHDYIQWLFPLPEPSAAVPGSPVISPREIDHIFASAAAQANLEAAAKRMARFYANNDHWLVLFDHNHLRITRIIKSLRLLSGNKAADDFREAILEYAKETGADINPTTLRYWTEA